jgi:hypothetical protein
MKTRVAIVAALLTVLASSCNNKLILDCTTSTVTRVKNRSLTMPQSLVDDQQIEARSC